MAKSVNVKNQSIKVKSATFTIDLDGNIKMIEKVKIGSGKDSFVEDVPWNFSEFARKYLVGQGSFDISIKTEAKDETEYLPEEVVDEEDLEYNDDDIDFEEALEEDGEE